MEQRGGILQATCFINQLFEIHRNSYAFCKAPRQRTGFRGLCDSRGFVQFELISLSTTLIAGSIVALSMKASSYGPTHAPKTREVEWNPEQSYGVIRSRWSIL